MELRHQNDGRTWRPKHVELETFQEKRILYIQLDSNKTYVLRFSLFPSVFLETFWEIYFPLITPHSKL
jgi:hypothetical protein